MEAKKCYVCGKAPLTKDEIGITKKIIDKKTTIIYCLPSSEGYITPEILKNRITDNTYLVSVMYANNEIGSIQPIGELCEIAHAHGALFHTDAVQAVGHVKINVHELGVDFLSASAHKFNGPKGIGFLYIRKGVEISPMQMVVHRKTRIVQEQRMWQR